MKIQFFYDLCNVSFLACKYHLSVCHVHVSPVSVSRASITCQCVTCKCHLSVCHVQVSPVSVSRTSITCQYVTCKCQSVKSYFLWDSPGYDQIYLHCLTTAHNYYEKLQTCAVLFLLAQHCRYVKTDTLSVTMLALHLYHAQSTG